MADIVREAPRLNVTWHGKCPRCSCTMTFTGYRADDTLEARALLGTVATQTFECMVCEEADIEVTCVAVCLDPWNGVPVEADDFEEEPEGA